ncbi:metallophosphoesterase family protein [Kaistella montana]|uniref:Metallophosphoesterase family protein n=1 Tax=Kaistella montana TaxID=1849733 RepID=A0ABW5K9W9_9FLAO|nr:metallophosphoesterase [Kaistella montana]MCQ4036046.1 metallophosphoesterase [Kaistella montana]
MNRHPNRLRLLVLALFLFLQNIGAQNLTKIAFLADIHFQDLYGNFSDNEYRGVINPKTGKPTLMRTMQSQLNSTRIFNENYFALFAALDDIADQGIKIVALPGDFTDDGQAYNLRGLKKILDQYEAKYQMSFYITTGNHDPVRPFRREAGKNDFLGENGSPVGIFSHPNGKKESIITKDIAESGYREILDWMKNFGFSPSEKDKFWQTPFSKKSYSEYHYQDALQDAEIQNRTYESSSGFQVPDLSYISEPVEGIWLMAIDGNTYIPEKKTGSPTDPNTYGGANDGYNNAIKYKSHLLSWVKRMTQEAEKQNKILIAFSHYPMVDFNNGATPELAELLGKDKWQLSRVPNENVTNAFAEAGIKIHFAGHMHINDSETKSISNGKMIRNFQVPSLAAYLPGYKVITIESGGNIRVETKTIANVKRYKELFPLYEQEYQKLSKTTPEKIWNKKILKTKNYKEFMLFHLTELVRLRMLPSEWPKDFVENTKTINGLDILNKTRTPNMDENLRNQRLRSVDFKKWSFTDVLLDLYKFQSAGGLATQDIPTKRLQQYAFLEKQLACFKPTDQLGQQLKLFFSILQKLSNGEDVREVQFQYQ